MLMQEAGAMYMCTCLLRQDSAKVLNHACRERFTYKDRERHVRRSVGKRKVS